MPGTPRLRTFLRRGTPFAVLAVVLGGVWLWLEGGRFLQNEDPLQHADAIFVLAGTQMERPLEGVDLYKEGWAPLIVISPGRPEPAERLVQSRGVRFPSYSSLVRDAMVQLGVPAAAIVANPGSMDNTASEANLLREMVIARQWRRVIVVTSKFHVRRAGFAFRRGLAGTGATPILRASRYDPADPARWWQKRADVRFAVSEWLKLVLYRFGLAA
jgi:uncharacterized SAM-binding protein YcdF (DUF218 family)